MAPCAKDPDKDASPPPGPLTQHRAAKMLARLTWDVVLALCTTVYLLLVLFDDLESPLLSIALIGMVSYTLARNPVRRR
jgi:hypothetical protein